MQEIHWRSDTENQNRDISNCDSDMIDPRDGKTYKTVKIGNQIWMAENLNYEMPDSRCYADNPENAKIHGRLYNWRMAKRIAPNGWHLPSKDEYQELIDCIGHDGLYSALKSTCGWHDMTGNGSNSSGFSALPSGYCIGCEYGDMERYRSLGMFAGFWTSTESKHDFGKACVMQIDLNFESAWWRHRMLDFNTTDTFLSVRLIKD